MVKKMSKENYLNNRDLLHEINLSKISYCEFLSEDYIYYDAIVEDINDIFKEETIKNAIKQKRERICYLNYKAALNAHEKLKQTNIKMLPPRPKLKDYKDYSEIKINELTFRVLTYEHISKTPLRKKTIKNISDNYAKLNFIPFKHFIIEDYDNKILKEVGKSHYKNGVFSTTHGKLTDNLVKMFILLVDRYSQRSNWRNYSYISEMQGQALLQLTVVGLKFNEYKSENPFAYITTIISRAFTRVLNTEKREQNIRDDLLEEYGKNPSFTRQLENDDNTKHFYEHDI